MKPKKDKLLKPKNKENAGKCHLHNFLFNQYTTNKEVTLLFNNGM